MPQIPHLIIKSTHLGSIVSMEHKALLDNQPHTTKHKVHSKMLCAYIFFHNKLLKTRQKKKMTADFKEVSSCIRDCKSEFYIAIIR